MRFFDYLRLGLSGVGAHKKRTFAIGAITGLLFSVIASGIFILQGLEDNVFHKMLQPTNGRLLVMTSVEKYPCGEKCNLGIESAKIKRNIEKYNGNVVNAKIIQTELGAFYKVDSSFLEGMRNPSIDNEVAIVVVTLKTAAGLVNIELPERDAELSEKLKNINDVRARTLKKIITSSTGKKYYIADILPGEVYAGDLSFANIRRGSPLDLVLGQISTGASQNLIIREAEIHSDGKPTPMEKVSGFVQAEDIDSEKMGIVFAEFENLEKAYNYYKDTANYCKKLDRFFGSCDESYKYHVASVISDPLSTYDSFKDIWSVAKNIALALGILAAIIAISTHIRLIAADIKIISLYRAMGASKHQLRLIYFIYLTFLNLVAVASALIVGLISGILLSLSNSLELEQLFTLGFGLESGSIYLVGWNNLALIIVGSAPLLAIISVLLGNGNFKTKDLIQRLK